MADNKILGLLLAFAVLFAVWMFAMSMPSGDVTNAVKILAVVGMVGTPAVAYVLKRLGLWK